MDSKDQAAASVTSSTHERKSRTAIIIKHDKLYMKHNSFGEDMPIAIVFKGMGIETDQELIQCIGPSETLVDGLALSMQEASKLGINTQAQALEYIASKIKVFRKPWAVKRSKVNINSTPITNIYRKMKPEKS
jgi:DNA-directed RNA polymerase III subunit RPC2